MKRSLALLLLALWPLAAPATGGDFDYTVNPKGVQQLFESTDTAYVFARAPDGKYVQVHHDGDTITLVRRLKDGTIDASFGFAGTITFPRATQVSSNFVVIPLTVKAILFPPDGKILLVGEATSACGTIGLARLKENGYSDSTFGFNGAIAAMSPSYSSALCLDGRNFTLGAVRLLADGRIVAAGYASDPVLARPTGIAVAARWLADGMPDPAFNGEGFARPIFSWLDHPGGASIADDGAVELVHSQPGAAGGPWTVVSTRLKPDGRTRTDTTLGVPDELRQAPGVAFGTSGSRFLHSRGSGDAGEVLVARVKGDDTADTFFGGGTGRARVTVDPRRDIVAAHGVPDGGVLLWASAAEPPNDAIDAIKLDAVGVLEPSFAANGRLSISTSLQSEFPHQVTMGPDGYVDLFASTLARVGGPIRGWYFARIQAVPDVVEFENTTLDHYFIVYDGAEARGIDMGAAGAGWRRTGQVFRPGGPTQVCRFYGTPGKGPNSHFYTADPDECEFVKKDAGWTYEGLAVAVTPAPTGRCPVGQDPVHRLYNQRFAQNDSNHRFTTNDSVLQSMVTRGWKYEGIAWCVMR